MSKSSTALNDIRKQICLSNGAEESVLYEVELASQYGMSRTPIRQILQRLAYERLVTTKSGVGTVITPLFPQERARDLITYRGLLSAATQHEVPEFALADRSELRVLIDLRDALSEGAAETHYEILSRLHGIAEELIRDPILRDAFAACHWRATRWHLADLRQNQASTDARLSAFLAELSQAQDAPAFLRQLPQFCGPV